MNFTKSESSGHPQKRYQIQEQAPTEKNMNNTNDLNNNNDLKNDPRNKDGVKYNIPDPKEDIEHSENLNDDMTYD